MRWHLGIKRRDGESAVGRENCTGGRERWNVKLKSWARMPNETKRPVPLARIIALPNAKPQIVSSAPAIRRLY
jgi:hypothetical protein